MTTWRRDNVPPAPKDFLWVDVLKGGMEKRYICFSEKPWGLWTHYAGKQTSPCCEDQSLCLGGHTEETLRWRGYLHCWSFERSEGVFLQCTASALWHFLRSLDGNTNLRGRTIIAKRTKSNKGRMSIGVDMYASPVTASLYKVRDPRASLEHLWRLKPSVHMLRSSLVTAPELIPEDALAM